MPSKKSTRVTPAAALEQAVAESEALWEHAHELRAAAHHTVRFATDLVALRDSLASTDPHVRFTVDRGLEAALVHLDVELAVFSDVTDAAHEATMRIPVENAGLEDSFTLAPTLTHTAKA